MRLRLCTAWALAAGLAAATTPRAEGDEVSIALLGIQDRAGDAAVASVMDRTLRSELTGRGRVLDARATRDAQRRLRLRSGDRATPALLSRLGQELQAGLLVSATLHDAVRTGVPRLTLSIRVYSTDTGRLIWAGFRGGSGLDHRTLLGLGVRDDAAGVAAALVRELLAELPQAPDGGAGTPSTALPGTGLGRLAIVPFAGSTARRGTANADTVTEAVRARLSGRVDLLSPNEAVEILRRFQAGRWGGITAETRAALHQSKQVDTILTGAVEAYAPAGPPLEPNPRVAISMRLLDAASGRILWTGWVERDGRRSLDLFRLGRVHSRGALTRNIVATLADQLDRASRSFGHTAEAR